jgi:hypothetical protein
MDAQMMFFLQYGYRVISTSIEHAWKSDLFTRRTGNNGGRFGGPTTWTTTPTLCRCGAYEYIGAAIQDVARIRDSVRRG